LKNRKPIVGSIYDTGEIAQLSGNLNASAPIVEFLQRILLAWPIDLQTRLTWRIVFVKILFVEKLILLELLPLVPIVQLSELDLEFVRENMASGVLPFSNV
jgi:hypothetical protein